MAKRTNVVFIMADDMGYGDFGMFNELSKTPALDQLAGDGLCLTQHYSASCVCTPARAGLLTGRYPHRTGAIEMRSIRGLDRLHLSERTIADMFKVHGYSTGLIGKWHTGVYGDEYHPRSRGFDEFFGFRGGAISYYDRPLEADRQYLKPDGRYLTDVFTEKAVDFIQRHQKEPFFLCLHYNAPHTPLEAPEEDVKAFLDPDRIGIGVSILYAMIHRMDKGVCRVREEIERLGLAENTIFIFTSDNGPAMYDWQDMKQGRFNCNFSHGKGHVYEGGIRVPMIINWPAGGLVGGRRFDEFAHFTDWVPTLLAAIGETPPTDRKLDGSNILPALQGEKGKTDPVRFWQWNRYTPLCNCNAAMRDHDWKLVRPAIAEGMWTKREEFDMDRELERSPELYTDILRTPEPERHIPEPPPVELYNIAEDPGETNNLAEMQPERAGKMLRELETWFEEVEAERLAR